MQACSSGVEHCSHMAEVGGSIPSTPTIRQAGVCDPCGWDACRSFKARLTRNPRRAAVRATLACWVLASAPFGCASPSGSADAVKPVAATGPATGFATTDYVIGPGDRLGIFVYDQPQLTLSDVPVRPDGRLSTPLVSDVTAAGTTPAQLSAALTAKLARYVRDPVVTVIVHDFVGPFDRQVRVIGEAADPQAIPYREHMTLLDVMIATKGLTRFAAGDSAAIVRRPARSDEPASRIPVRLSDLMKDGDISANVEMQPGDTLIIPQSWF